ncbi:MAG: DUF485 domain-containing protein, partial [Acidihalobacter sp.]
SGQSGDLMRRRSRFGWTLNIAMVPIYWSFILVIAFNPGPPSQPLGETSVITLCVPIGVLTILVAFCVCLRSAGTPPSTTL